MFNCLLEPCLPCGIRSNEERAIAAAVLSCTLPLLVTKSHSLFNPVPPAAKLACVFLFEGDTNGRTDPEHRQECLCYLYAATPVTLSPITSAWMWSVPSYVLTVSRLHICRIMGYSSVIPLAPSRSRLRRAHSSAMLALLRLSMETCAGSSRPWSFNRPHCIASNCALVISVIM